MTKILKINILLFFCVLFFSCSVIAGEFKVNFLYTDTGVRDPFIPSEFQTLFNITDSTSFADNVSLLSPSVNS